MQRRHIPNKIPILTQVWPMRGNRIDRTLQWGMGRRDNDVSPDLLPKAWEPGVLMSGGRRRWMSQLKQQVKMFFLCLFVLLGPSKDWMALTHIGWASQVPLMVKNMTASAGDVRDMGPIPGSRRSPGEEHSSILAWNITSINQLQYSCLETHVDREAWRTTVHWVTRNLTWLKWFSRERYSFWIGPSASFSSAVHILISSGNTAEIMFYQLSGHPSVQLTCKIHHHIVHMFHLGKR